MTNPAVFRTNHIIVVLFGLFLQVQWVVCTQDEIGLSFVELSPAKVIASRSVPILLNCTGQDANGGQIKYRWKHNNMPIEPNDKHFEQLGSQLVIKRLLANPKTRHRTDGSYVCLISNALGTLTSRKIEVQSTKTPKVLRIRTQSNSCKEGENFRMLCDLNSNPKSWYSWYLDDEPLQESNTVYTLADSSVLHILNASKANEGKYTCEANNNFLRRRSNRFNLQVFEAEDDYKSIIFLNDNRTTSVATRGDIVTLECLINLAYPDATITWKRMRNKHFHLSNQPNKRHSPKSKYRRFRIIGESNLQIKNVERDDEDTYICLASYKLDEFDISHHIEHRLNVHVIPERHSKVLPSSAIFKYEGQSAILDCGQVYGHPRPSIHWLKDGENLLLNDRFNITHDKLPLNSSHVKHRRSNSAKLENEIIVHSQLLISNTEKQDSGYYQCVVENEKGSVRTEFALTINETNSQPNPPTHLRVQVIDSSTAELSWTAPPFHAEIVGYTIHYMALNSRFGMEREEATDRNFIRFVGLKPYTNYSFYVLAYSTESASEPSETKVFLTGEEAPIEIPYFQLQPINSTSLLVDWDELSNEEARGRIINYKVDFKKIDSTHVNTLLVGGDESFVVLTQLQPEVVYEVRVIAANSKGYPKKEIIDDVDWVTVKMPKQSLDEFDVVLSLELSNFSDVKSNWELRNKAGYKVNFAHHAKSADLIYRRLNEKETRNVALDVDQTSYLIEKIEPGEYVFTVEVHLKSAIKVVRDTQTISIPKLEPEEANTLVDDVNHLKATGYPDKQLIASTVESLQPTSPLMENELSKEINISENLTEIDKQKPFDISSVSKPDTLPSSVSEDPVQISSTTSIPTYNNSSPKPETNNLTLDSLLETNDVFNEIQEPTNTSKLLPKVKEEAVIDIPSTEDVKNATNEADSFDENLSIKDILKLKENNSNEVSTPISVESSSTLTSNVMLTLNNTSLTNQTNSVEEKELVESFSNEINTTLTKMNNLNDSQNLIENQNHLQNKFFENKGNDLEDSKISASETNYDIAKYNETDNTENVKLNRKYLLEEEYYKEMDSQDKSIFKKLKDTVQNLLNASESIEILQENISKSKTINITSTESSIANISETTPELQLNTIDKTSFTTTSKPETTLFTSTVSTTTATISTTTETLPKFDFSKVIYQFEVTPTFADTVHCHWNSDYNMSEITFYVKYNPDYHHAHGAHFAHQRFGHVDHDDYLFVRTAQHSVTITNLLPYTIYNFALYFEIPELAKFDSQIEYKKFNELHFENFAQRSNDGKSYRLVKQTRTLEALPGRPTDFTGIALNAQQVQLSWRSPEQSNGIIVEYIVYYTPGEHSNRDMSEWTRLAMEGEQFALVVKDLSPSTQYNFIVRARNGAGLGAASPQLILRTLSNHFHFALDALDTHENNHSDFHPNRSELPCLILLPHLQLTEQHCPQLYELLLLLALGITTLFIFICIIAICHRICLCNVREKPPKSKMYHQIEPLELQTHFLPTDNCSSTACAHSANGIFCGGDNHDHLAKQTQPDLLPGNDFTQESHSNITEDLRTHAPSQHDCMIHSHHHTYDSPTHTETTSMSTPVTHTLDSMGSANTLSAFTPIKRKAQKSDHTNNPRMSLIGDRINYERSYSEVSDRKFNSINSYFSRKNRSRAYSDSDQVLDLHCTLPLRSFDQTHSGRVIPMYLENNLIVGEEESGHDLTAHSQGKRLVEEEEDGESSDSSAGFERKSLV